MSKNYSGMSTNERRSYYRDLNTRVVSINLGDREIKEKLQAVADADSRSKNSWMKKYVLPVMLKELEKQYAEMKSSGKIKG